MGISSARLASSSSTGREAHAKQPMRLLSQRPHTHGIVREVDTYVEDLPMLGSLLLKSRPRRTEGGEMDEPTSSDVHSHWNKLVSFDSFLVLTCNRNCTLVFDRRHFGLVAEDCLFILFRIWPGHTDLSAIHDVR